MQTIILKQFGGIENLIPAELPLPLIAPDEVLIKTHAISINPVDIKTRRGEAQAANISNEQPIILGWDISGTVTAAGTAVRHFQPGDEAFGTIRFPGHGKAYARYIAAPESQLARKPAGITHPEAAAATLAALTAWKALVTYGNLRPGQKVLIHGASGGVGHYAVQIARHIGAYVIGTASTPNKNFVLQLGADQFIDYRTQSFEKLLHNCDLIIDSIGGGNFARSLTVLAPGGTIINLPTNKATEAEALARQHHIRNFRQMHVESSGEDLRHIAGLLRNGHLRSHISHTFPFSAIPQAHQQMETGNTVGKIIINV